MVRYAPPGRNEVKAAVRSTEKQLAGLIMDADLPRQLLASNDRLRTALDNLARAADTAELMLRKDHPAEAQSLAAHVRRAREALGLEKPSH